MAFMDELQIYKQSVLEILWRSDDIKSIIQNSAGLDNMTYAQFRKYVKNYAKNPDTIKEKGVYILFEVDPEQIHNPTTMSYRLSIWVVISEELMEQREQNGVLSDILIAKIDRLLNGNTQFGIGKLGLSASKGFNVPVGFYGRYVTYVSEDFNRV